MTQGSEGKGSCLMAGLLWFVGFFIVLMVFPYGAFWATLYILGTVMINVD